MSKPMTKKEALRIVFVECSNPYARSYANKGLYMEGEELDTQILYVLSNLGGWRGERAREVKKALRS